ncbi:hypothetical protein EVAR_97330_1 [Eumeta japonica]|uniref:Uncharacterized protein n=1 Tax=Eumeta variegata TaxID=151549 RepID=A0A4C1X9Q1_EUMVA|nr:hypothetical protein EVAR_97330_1 [Eumeta japonica]
MKKNGKKIDTTITFGEIDTVIEIDDMRRTTSFTQLKRQPEPTAVRPHDGAPPRKPALRISFTVASQYKFLRWVGKMMYSVSMFRCVHCNRSFTSGGRSTNATDAHFFLVFSLRGEGYKKRVRGVCPPYTDQKTPESTCRTVVVLSSNCTRALMTSSKTAWRHKECQRREKSFKPFRVTTT